MCGAALAAQAQTTRSSEQHVCDKLTTSLYSNLWPLHCAGPVRRVRCRPTRSSHRQTGASAAGTTDADHWERAQWTRVISSAQAPHGRVVPVSPQERALDVIVVRHRSARPAHVWNRPRSKGFAGGPAANCSPLSWVAHRFPEVNHLFQQSYDSIADRRSQRQQSRRSPEARRRWRAECARSGSTEEYAGVNANPTSLTGFDRLQQESVWGEGWLWQGALEGA